MAGKALQVGILALQGAVEPHVRALKQLGVDAVQVRKSNHLLGLSGLILPGGESSAMIHLLNLNQLWEPLRDFAAVKPVWGVCAGAILLAREVTHPSQVSLEALDITVSRNAYGRQIDSFTAPLVPTEHWLGQSLEGVFIRAPRITSFGPSIKVLFTYNGEAVMVEDGKKMASTFHPELTENAAVHEYFVGKCTSEKTPWMTDFQSTYVSPSVN